MYRPSAHQVKSIWLLFIGLAIASCSNEGGNFGSINKEEARAILADSEVTEDAQSEVVDTSQDESEVTFDGPSSGFDDSINPEMQVEAEPPVEEEEEEVIVAEVPVVISGSFLTISCLKQSEDGIKVVIACVGDGDSPIELNHVSAYLQEGPSEDFFVLPKSASEQAGFVEFQLSNQLVSMEQNLIISYEPDPQKDKLIVKSAVKDIAETLVPMQVVAMEEEQIAIEAKAEQAEATQQQQYRILVVANDSYAFLYPLEQQTIISLIDELEVDLNLTIEYSYVPFEELDVATAKDYSLIIWNDHGYFPSGIDDLTTNKLFQLYQMKIPFYFIGDDIAYSNANLSSDEQVLWKQMTFLEFGSNNAGNTTSVAIEPIDDFPPINGSFGRVENFEYSIDADYAGPMDLGETVLAYDAFGHVVICAFPGDETRPRSVTQNVMVAGEQMTPEANILFKNSVKWLLSYKENTSNPSP